MRFLPLLIVFTCATALIAENKHEGSYIHDITTDYKTPHLEWKTSESKPLKSLFIVSRAGGREVAELAQRFNIDYSALTVARAYMLAIENTYESAIEGTSTNEKKQELLEKLEHNYDIIILGNVGFDTLPAEAQFNILSKVADGTGLLFVYPQKTKYEKMFSSLSPGAQEILALAPTNVFSGPLAEIPQNVLLKTFSFGTGRIAVINYKKNHPAIYEGLSLTIPDEYSRNWTAKYENNMLLLMRTILWTAGQKLVPKIECPELSSSPELEQKPQAFTLNIKGGSGGQLLLRLRNEYNNIIFEKKSIIDKNVIFEIPLLPAGKYYLDVAAGENVGIFCFSVKSPTGSLNVHTDDNFPKGGKEIKAVLDIEKAFTEDLILKIELSDSPYGNIWYEKTRALPSGKKKIDFSISDYYLPTLAGTLKCRIFKGTHELANIEKTLYFPKREKEIYTQLSWGAVPESYIPPFYAAQIVDRLGWNMGLNHPSKDGGNAKAAALFNQFLIPYMLRVVIKNSERHGTWSEPSYLKNKPIEDKSFYNPEIKEAWRELVAGKIKNLPKLLPPFYSLGDENTFDYNVGFSPYDEKEFKEFLKRKYNSIDKLNTEWKSSYKSFEEVKHYTLKEAVEQKNFAAWYDHRQFMEKQYADIHHFLAEEIRRHDPGALVGAEGSVPGDLEQTIKGLEFWGPYSDLVMDEVLRSIGNDKIRMCWWGAYVGSHGGRNNSPIPLWRNMLSGTVNGSAWFASYPGHNESMLGSDMSFAKYFKSMLPYLDELKNGAAQLLINTHLMENGIAVFYSHTSGSARLLDPRCVNPQDSMGTFIRFCYSTGLNFDFITGSMMPEKLSRYKVLFLFGASAISETEAAEIKKFAKNGGVVIADINPGIMNEYLRPPGNNMLESLFGDITWNKITKPELTKISIDTIYNDKKLVFNASKALSCPGIPVFGVREIGKGKAVLLNFSFSSAQNSACKETSLKQFLLDFLAAGNILPYVKIEGIDANEKFMQRVRSGDGFKVIGFLCDEKELGKKAKLILQERSFIFRPDKGFQGASAILDFKIDCPFMLFTAYERMPTAPVLTAASEAVPGKPLKLEISGSQEGSILRLQVINPSGIPMSLRDKIIAAENKGKAQDIYFAYNDPSGIWTVKVTDVNTGLCSEKQIVLNKTSNKKGKNEAQDGICRF